MLCTCLPPQRASSLNRTSSTQMVCRRFSPPIFLDTFSWYVPICIFRWLQKNQALNNQHVGFNGKQDAQFFLISPSLGGIVFSPCLGQTKDYKDGIYCLFPAWHSVSGFGLLGLDYPTVPEHSTAAAHYSLGGGEGKCPVLD